jgi:hypothetical protein
LPCCRAEQHGRLTAAILVPWRDPPGHALPAEANAERHRCPTLVILVGQQGHTWISPPTLAWTCSPLSSAARRGAAGHGFEHEHDGQKEELRGGRQDAAAGGLLGSPSADNLAVVDVVTYLVW